MAYVAARRYAGAPPSELVANADAHIGDARDRCGGRRLACELCSTLAINVDVRSELNAEAAGLPKLIRAAHEDAAYLGMLRAIC